MIRDWLEWHGKRAFNAHSDNGPQSTESSKPVMLVGINRHRRRSRSLRPAPRRLDIARRHIGRTHGTGPSSPRIRSKGAGLRPDPRPRHRSVRVAQGHRGSHRRASPGTHS